VKKVIFWLLPKCISPQVRPE